MSAFSVVSGSGRHLDKVRAWIEVRLVDRAGTFLGSSRRLSPCQACRNPLPGMCVVRAIGSHAVSPSSLCAILASLCSYAASLGALLTPSLGA